MRSTLVKAVDASRRRILLAMLVLLPGADAVAMDSRLSFFSHLDIQHAFRGQNQTDDRLKLGESALFGYLALSDKLSVSTEISYLAPRYRSDTVKVERFMVRYEASEKVWLGIGKMHTPVNYWNDSYHHGRLLFPTIDRPLSFERFIPIHETGMRLAGRRLGSKNFNFDVVVSSGQGSEGRLFARGVKSFTGRVGVSPFPGLDLQAAYYEQRSGGLGAINVDSPDYTGSRLRTESHELYGLSAHWRGEDWVTLTELAYAHFQHSDERNFAAYQYAGLERGTGIRPYLYLDYLDVDHGSFEENERTKLRTGLGVAFILAPTTDLKVQLEWQHFKFVSSESTGLAVKVQLSFGL